MKKNWLIAFLFIAGLMPARSQDYDYRVGLEAPATSGYHRIHLSPEVSGLMTRSLSDLRIYDDSGKETPYFTSTEVRSTHYTHFKTYPIYDIDRNSRWHYDSRYYVKNTSGKPIRELILKIANFEDTRNVRLSGSDDGQTWFTIKDSYVFHDLFSEDEAFTYKVLRFPLSDYKRFKIEIDDHYTHSRYEDYINIKEVGYFDNSVESGAYSYIKGVSVQQKDTRAKETDIFIDLRKKHLVDKIRVNVNSDGHYHRQAELFQKVKDSDTSFHWKPLRKFWLSSTALNELNFDRLKTQELKLVIYNKDDTPLDIKKLDFLQLKNHLTAKLEAGTMYTLAFGNDTLQKPEYDIVYFKEEIGKKLPELKPKSDIQKVKTNVNLNVSIGNAPLAAVPEKPLAKPAPEITPAFYEQQYFVWIILGAVVILFGYMSVRMMSEVKKRTNNPDQEE